MVWVSDKIEVVDTHRVVDKDVLDHRVEVHLDDNNRSFGWMLKHNHHHSNRNLWKAYESFQNLWEVY